MATTQTAPAPVASGPPQMRAMYIMKYGGNDVVRIGGVHRPHPGPKEVLVEVHSASLNPIDYKIRSGDLKQVRSFEFPLVLGFDVSGVVIDKGAEANQFQIGDEVFSRTVHPGTVAEYIADDQRYFARKPTNISHSEAASLPLVALTAWQVLHDKARVERGQKVLIHGGSGGVGSAAIQIAKHLGAYVVTTCSGDNIDFVKRIGADEAIDYKTQQFWTTVKDANVVFDTIGGNTLAKSFQCVVPGGAVISIASTPDATGMKVAGAGPVFQAIGQIANTPNFFRAWRRKVRFAFHMMQPYDQQLQQIADIVTSGSLRPMVGAHYPLERAAEALSKLETGHGRGKIVIDVKPDVTTPRNRDTTFTADDHSEPAITPRTVDATAADEAAAAPATAQTERTHEDIPLPAYTRQAPPENKTVTAEDDAQL